MWREEHFFESTLKRYQKYLEEMKAKGLRVFSSLWWDALFKIKKLAHVDI